MLKLLYCYYKDLIIINISVSLCVALIAFATTFNIAISSLVFSNCFISGGYIISVFYYEIAKNNQYYFFYNRGLSKLSLYILSFLFNLTIGGLFILIFNLCKIYLK